MFAGGARVKERLHRATQHRDFVNFLASVAATLILSSCAFKSLMVSALAAFSFSRSCMRFRSTACQHARLPQRACDSAIKANESGGRGERRVHHIELVWHWAKRNAGIVCGRRREGGGGDQVDRLPQVNDDKCARDARSLQTRGDRNAFVCDELCVCVCVCVAVCV